MNSYPEHDKIKAAKDSGKLEPVIEFLEYLLDENLVISDEDGEDIILSDYDGIDSVLQRWQGVDSAKLEKEKLDMLTTYRDVDSE